jgi:hypothetical protein
MTALLQRMQVEDAEAPTFDPIQQENDCQGAECPKAQDLQNEKDAAQTHLESGIHAGQIQKPNAAQKKQAAANKVIKGAASSGGHTTGKPAEKASSIPVKKTTALKPLSPAAKKETRHASTHVPKPSAQSTTKPKPTSSNASKRDRKKTVTHIYENPLEQKKIGGRFEKRNRKNETLERKKDRGEKRAFSPCFSD